jgi:hypothetical protein
MTKAVTQAVTHHTTDLDQLVRHLAERVDILSVKIALLERPSGDPEWVSVRVAANHPSIRGRLTSRQIRDRVLRSIADPVTACFVANVHYQVIPTPLLNKYVVSPIAIGEYLANASGCLAN